MKRLIYQVYVGKRSKLYDWCTASVLDYARWLGVDYIIQTEPILRVQPDPFVTNRSREAVERLGYLPIFEKENAFEYFDRYDDIAIIDSDVFIRPQSPSIFDELQGHDFGVAIERDMPITEQYKNKIRGYSRMQYEGIHKSGKVNFRPNDLGYEFGNMGVMLMGNEFPKYLKGQTPKQFLQRPEFQGFINGLGAWKWSTDQTLLNTWIRDSGMKWRGIDWRFNGLFTANKKIRECHFVHFFLKDKLPNRGENIEELKKVI